MSPATTLSEQILEQAVEQEASDIHFIPFEQSAYIYFRVHGLRLFHKEIPFHQYNVLLAHYKFISGMDIGEIQKPQNGTHSFTNKINKYALRLSTLPVQSTESLAIRILPQQESRHLDQLFLFPHQYKKMKEWITLTSGLLLMTGPTGSGKSTTLYALLRQLMFYSSRQLITLEDPIEQQLSGVLQMQLNAKAGITYVEGFKAILRHDPDVVMIGEIRDASTAAFAVNAALSGHVVFSTFHASDAKGTITRLLEMGIDRLDLAEALKGIASIELIQLQHQGHRQKRAAILEMLTETHIKAIIHERDVPPFESFHHLRKKAFAYGFI